MPVAKITRPVALAAALAWAASPPGVVAQTYKVEVRPALDDLPVKIETVESPGVLVVRLTNSGTVRVRCDLRYDASPQPIGRAYVYVDPGETAQDAFRAKRKWFEVTVDVKCRPADSP